MDSTNGYILSRTWFDFCFENPEKIKPNHTALYFFAIEHCNRLGWKNKFGLPSSMAMEAIGIKSYNTYINTLRELVFWGFIEMIEVSKNQYSSNIIALSKYDKALDKALDKAFIKHVTKHTTKQSESTSESISESIDSIDKQITNKQINNKQINHEPLEKKFSKKDFKNILLELGCDETHVDDWIAVRISKKATFTETAFKKFIKECNDHNFQVPEAVKICAENSWSGFKYQWVINTNQTQNGKQPPKTNEQIFKSAMESEVGRNFRFK